MEVDILYYFKIRKHLIQLNSPNIYKDIGDNVLYIIYYIHIETIYSNILYNVIPPRRHPLGHALSQNAPSKL